MSSVNVADSSQGASIVLGDLTPSLLAGQSTSGQRVGPAAAAAAAPVEVAWHSIAEILLRIFQTLLARGDLWSLADASRVCRTWRRVASLVAARYATALRVEEPSAQVIETLTRLAHGSWMESFAPDAQGSLRECPPGAPFATSTTPADDAFCNRALGALLGRGSFARVFSLGGISAWCIKVASGGLAARDRFQLGRGAVDKLRDVMRADARIASMQHYYYSSGSASALLSHKQVSLVLYYEYARLQHVAALPLPPQDPYPLFPKPIAWGVRGVTSYYVMERLHGITLRTVLSAAMRRPRVPSAKREQGRYAHQFSILKKVFGSAAARVSKETVDSVSAIVDDLFLIEDVSVRLPKRPYEEIDFGPLVTRLLLYLDHLQAEFGFLHGDMKPENIMLVPDGATGWRLRLIDPVPAPSDSLPSVVSLPYNPIAFLDWRADFTSALLLLHEVVTGKRLFDRFRAPCDDLTAITDNANVCLSTVSNAMLHLRMPLADFENARYNEPKYTHQLRALAQAVTACAPRRFVLRVPSAVLPPRPPQ